MRTLLAAIIFVSACSANKDDVTEDFSDLGGLDTKSDAFSYRMRIVGSLIYGETSDPISYTRNPRFRAIKFAGAEGDQIDLWVRSASGDAVAWVLDDSFDVVAMNDDAEDEYTLDSHIVVTLPAHPSATHYIVFREYSLHKATFTATLNGIPGAGSCTVDADCALVERGCCPIGDYTSVPVSQVEAFEAAKNCSHAFCPAIAIEDRGTVALCNADSHVCEAVAGADVLCGTRTANPHQCAPGWICYGPNLPIDGGGWCAKFCGGFGNFGCPADFSCADDPNDSCDPNAGGADCGGICL